MVIDTSIIIEFLRAKNKQSTRLYQLSEANSYYISAVTLFELNMGATTPGKKQDVAYITSELDVLNFDGEASVKAAEIYHKLRAVNQIIEFRDIFIAATCLANNLPLITNNTKHFARIEGLTII